MTDMQRGIYLVQRANSLANDKDRPKKVLADQQFYESGYESAETGGEIYSCSIAPGEPQDDWIRGFLAADFDNSEGAEWLETSGTANSSDPPLENSQLIEPEPEPEYSLADL